MRICLASGIVMMSLCELQYVLQYLGVVECESVSSIEFLYDIPIVIKGWFIYGFCPFFVEPLEKLEYPTVFHDFFPFDHLIPVGCCQFLSD